MQLSMYIIDVEQEPSNFWMEPVKFLCGKDCSETVQVSVS